MRRRQSNSRQPRSHCTINHLDIMRKLLLCAILLFGSVSGLAAQDAAETAIQKELDAMLEAWNRDDLDAHLAPYADSATWTTSTGLLHGKAAIRETLVKSFQRGTDLLGELSFGKPVFRRLGPDAMVTNGSFTVGNLPSGKSINGQSTLIWKRTGSTWQILHDHSS
jgi:ketosteroid isomerase-like protein